MGKKSGRRRLSSDHYSLPQVAVMLLATAELWMGATRPKSVDLSSKAPVAPDSELPTVVHADLVRRLRMGDPESVINGLVDLEAAMALVNDHTRRGIASFVEYGPEAVEEDGVHFGPFQARHVLTVWRAINKQGEFSEEEKVVQDVPAA